MSLTALKVFRFGSAWLHALLIDCFGVEILGFLHFCCLLRYYIHLIGTIGEPFILESYDSSSGSFSESESNIFQTMRLTFQTAAVGPGGVEILVVIVLLKFLKKSQKKENILGINLIINFLLLFKNYKQLF